MEQAGEEPAVEIPYLSSEVAIEKENTDGEKEEVPDNEKSDILETVFMMLQKLFPCIP